MNNKNNTGTTNTANLPVSLAIEDMMKKLVGVINDSPLPASVSLLIVQGLLNNIRNAAQEEYDSDLQKYQEQLKSNTSDEEK